MTTIGYATLQIIPSLTGVSESVNKQLDGALDGKKYGKAFGKDIASGMRASESDVKRAADNYAKLYDHVADATGKLRTAEAQLQQLRKTGANDARIIAAEERASKARRDEIRLINDAKVAYRQLDQLRNNVGNGPSILSRLVSEQKARDIGTKVGRVLGLAIAGAAGAGIAGIGYTLTKGFERLQSIDQATFKLKALGHSGAETKTIMDNATASVKGTAFSLAEAATTAASAVAAGIQPGKDLTQYLTNVADASAVAGTSMKDMGDIFNGIQTQNKAYTGDLDQLATRGIPIFQWLAKEYGVTGDALSKMVQNGEVDAAHFNKAISDNIGGAAKNMGQSFQGSIDNAETAIARLGAHFLGSIFGDKDGSQLAGPTEAIGKLTEKFDKIDAWVQAHGPQIHQFFTDMVNDIKPIVEKLGEVAGFLTAHPGLVEAAAAAYVVFKGAQVVGSIQVAIGKVLELQGVIGAGSGVGATGLIGGVYALAGALGIELGFTIFDKMQQKARDAQAAIDETNRKLHEQFPGQPVTPAGVPAQTGSTTPNNPLNPNNIYGHAAGGYTGNLPGNRIAGVVHGDEHVIKATSRRSIENAYPGLLDFMNKNGRLPMPGYAGGGVVAPDVSAAEKLVGTAYSQGQRFDCSGDVARVINAALGMGGGLMSTKTAREWLAARGFVPGTGGPGQISVGWYDHGPNPNDGHMSMTLSDGRPAEGGGSHGVFLVGAGAAGADSPQFDQHMFLPTIYGEGPAGPSSASPFAGGSAAAAVTGAPTAAPSVSGGGTSSSSGGGGGSFSLPSSLSGLASFGLDNLGSGIGKTGSGSDLSLFGKAAGSAVSGQVDSLLGVLGVNGSPGWLKAASMLVSGIKVGGGSSAAPLSATPTISGTPPPDDPGNMHGSRAGQPPGPQTVYNIRTATVEDAFLAAQRKQNERNAAKLSRF